MQIAIGLPIGYQAGAAAQGETPTWLLYDAFTSNLSAGNVDGTAAEPGPGVRSVTDTDGDAILITSGALRLQNTNSQSGDPGAWWSPVTRAVGRVLFGTATYASIGGFSYPIGWDSNTSGLGHHQFRITGIGNVQLYNNNVGPLIGAISTGAGTYAFAVILRASGAMYFLKSSGGDWLLLWIGHGGAQSPLYPVVTTFNQPFDVDDVIVPASRWLPSPVVSDGFGSWGTSDGEGHAEGVADASYGLGGDGVTWTATAGTWGAGGGVAAATALSGGLAYATVDAGTADLIITCEVTRAGGTAGIVVRWVDADNHVQLRHTGTNIQLVKVVGGTPTTLIDTSATYVAGARVRLVAEGTSFRVFYNDEDYGSEETIADAGLQSPTVVGLRTSDTGNTFDDLVVYARGTDGEYDTVLDALMGGTYT